ncbi:uncharacterized protein LTR77_002537 [Saxophila tyrrhenica]|uniref:ASST-domain-containing protein n=1 Tax=Saxophila tyrrhenica TaxID=1690608 RepID=A0AAV9PKV1_9PEZI|nr:hypothetical protein LTR77_002537 [Saxophila tyrrhenica]
MALTPVLIAAVLLVMFSIHRLVLPVVVWFLPSLESFFYELAVFGVYREAKYVTLDVRVPHGNMVKWDDSCDDGLVFFAPFGASVKRPGPIIFDAKGELVWASESFETVMNFNAQKYKGKTYLTFWAGEKSGGEGSGTAFMLGSSYNVWKQIRAVGKELRTDLHEFAISDDGPALVSAIEDTFVDARLPSWWFFREGQWIEDSVFQEIDIETDELVFQWRSQDHFRPEDSYFWSPFAGYVRSLPFDFFHLNSVQKDSKGSFLVSSRHLHKIMYVNGTTGEVLWTLGGAQNVKGLTDLSGGLASSFEWQHHARWQSEDEGILTLMDNGAAGGFRGTAQYSKALMIKVDHANRTAELLHWYAPMGKTRSRSQGSVEVLPNGNVFVGWGPAAAWSEYNVEGDLLCEYHFAASSMFYWARVKSYRTFKVYDWKGEPDYPPTAKIKDGKVYVSWNGATEVKFWKLQGVYVDQSTMKEVEDDIEIYEKRGFESALILPKSSKYGHFRVAALDANQETIRTSRRAGEVESDGSKAHVYIGMLIVIAAAIGVWFLLKRWVWQSARGQNCREMSLPIPLARYRYNVAGAESVLSDSEADVHSVYDDSDFEDEAISAAPGHYKRHSISRVLIRHPRQRATSDAKSQQADEERVRRVSSGAPTSYVPLSIQPSQAEDTAPVLDAGPVIKPPPDYAAATANHEEEERRALALRALGYRDVEDFLIRTRADAFDSAHPLVRNGLLGERGTSDTRQEAAESAGDSHESASSSSDLYDRERGEATSLISEKPTGRQNEERPWKIRDLLRQHWCVVIMGVVTMCAVLSTALLARASQRPQTVDEEPSAFSPSEQTEPQLPHPRVVGCKWSNFQSTSAEFPWYTKDGELGTWNPFNLSFVEDIPELPRNIRFSGSITITEKDDFKVSESQLLVDVATTHGLKVPNIDYRSPTPGALELLQPHFKMQATQGCMDVAIRITVPFRYFDLDTVIVNTTHFDIIFEELETFKPKYDPWTDDWTSGCDLWNTTFHSSRGNITGHGWESQNTVVTTGEDGSIFGTWPMKDELTLKSKRGDIIVGVAPQNRSTDRDEDPFPWFRANQPTAKLSFGTESGNIQTEIIRSEGQAKVPNREFVVDVQSTSGDVEGVYLLGTNTSIKTGSGDMNIRLVPVYSNQTYLAFNAETTGNKTSYVWLMEPIIFLPDAREPISAAESPAETKKCLNVLHMQHLMQGGWLQYTLPDVWGGTAHLRSHTIQETIYNRDFLHVLENRTDFMSLRRDGGNASLDLESVEGGIYLDYYE